MINLLKNTPVSLITLMISNLLLLILFIIGKVVLIKREDALKFFSNFTVAVCILFIIYFVSILWFTARCLLIGTAGQAFIFPVFAFIPFIIGKFASYDRVHFYTNLQIFALIASLELALLLV